MIEIRCNVSKQEAADIRKIAADEGMLPDEWIAEIARSALALDWAEDDNRTRPEPGGLGGPT